MIENSVIVCKMTFLIVKWLDMMCRIPGIWKSRTLFHRYSFVRIVMETVSSVLLKRHVVIIVAGFHDKFICWGVFIQGDCGIGDNWI